MAESHHFLIYYRVSGPHDRNSTGMLVAIQQPELHISIAQQSCKLLLRFTTPGLTLLRCVDVGKTDVQFSKTRYISDQTVTVYYSYDASTEFVAWKSPVITNSSFSPGFSLLGAFSKRRESEKNRERCD